MARSICWAPISATTSADAHGLLVSRRGRRLPLHGALAGLLLQIADLPAHGGPGTAPDPGHHRHLHRARRSDAGDLGRRDLSVRAAGLALSAPCRCRWSRAYPIYRLVLLGIAIVIGIALWLFLNRTRVGMMIRAGVDDRAMLSGLRRQRAADLRHHLRASAPGWRALPASSAARRCPSRRARTPAICWPRWWWSSSAAWAA